MSEAFLSFHSGMQIFVNNFIQDISVIKQIKFPKSKKKRILKKWAKRPGNLKTEIKEQFIMIGNSIYVNQEQYDKLIKSFDENNT